MNEFDIIEQYFKPLTQGHDDLKDDAAILDIPEGHELVVTSDTLNEGIHFMMGEAPENIAHKALRVNLSDLAAMGAKPLSYQLNIAFAQKPDEAWLAAFTKALLTDQKTYGIFCSGGDTTSIKGTALSLSITAMGTVPKGKAIRRCNARAGDKIIVTNPVGDAYLGLKASRENLDFPESIKLYRKPRPRLKEIHNITQYINAAADISDGFLADCGHIANASGLGLSINTKDFVFSNDFNNALNQKIITMQEALSGGDDYELVLAVAPENTNAVIDHLESQNCCPFIAGEFTAQKNENRLTHEGKTMLIDKDTGWTHF